MLPAGHRRQDLRRRPQPLSVGGFVWEKPQIPALTPPEMQIPTTARDQMIDLATRGTQMRQAGPQRKAIAQKMAAQNILPQPAQVQVIPPEQARPLLGDVIPALCEMPLRLTLTNKEKVMNELQISHREMRLAETVSRQLTSALTRRKLTPAFSDFYITRLAGMTPLIAVLDTAKLGDHSPYINAELLHQLSTDLGGLPVYLSNHSGLRYVVLLSPLPKLPRKVELPLDVPRGKLAIGVRFTGQPVLLDWKLFSIWPSSATLARGKAFSCNRWSPKQSGRDASAALGY